MDCSPPGSSVHGILQARIQEWVAISSSRGSSRPRDGTRVSCVSSIGRRVLYRHCRLGSTELPRVAKLNNQNLGAGARTLEYNNQVGGSLRRLKTQKDKTLGKNVPGCWGPSCRPAFSPAWGARLFLPPPRCHLAHACPLP